MNLTELLIDVSCCVRLLGREVLICMWIGCNFASYIHMYKYIHGIPLF